MVPPDSDETLSGSRAPNMEALFQAQRKAASLASRFPGAVLIGSDTLISFEGAVIGKPRDPDDARKILKRLRGRAHQVVTAVSMRGKGEIGTIETATVRMRDFGDAELDAYVATGDSLDKAGAYSVQGLGRNLIESVDGDYLAVMGLPLRAVAKGLGELGVPVAADVDALYRERDFLNWKTIG